MRRWKDEAGKRLLWRFQRELWIPPCRTSSLQENKRIRVYVCVCLGPRKLIQVPSA